MTSARFVADSLRQTATLLLPLSYTAASRPLGTKPGREASPSTLRPSLSSASPADKDVRAGHCRDHNDGNDDLHLEPPQGMLWPSPF
jgi:hypothetical protein